ncbi:MAG: MBL fold metallo-hydrolase [Phycisphaerales bacterium]
MPDVPDDRAATPESSATGAQERPEIRAFALGPFQTNCFVICQKDAQPGDPCWVADCGMEPQIMLDEIEKLGLVPEVVVLTHAHLDHIGGLFAFRSKFPDCPIWIHEAEEQWLTDPNLNLSARHGIEVTGPTPDRLLKDDDVLTLCGEPWEVRHTPGHSPGGISLVHQNSPVAIVGDTLFNGSIGRHDFPGSDFATLAKSIQEKLYTLAPETVALPGHGPVTQIGHEKLSNPFVRGDSVMV